MASEGRGSILLKLAIIILIAALVAVIVIPGRIWDKEAREEKIAHENMMSIYESEKFFNRKTGNYTTDPSELISVVRQDSNILQQQQLVNYTRKLSDQLGSYLDNDYIALIMKINKNIDNIIVDIESNKRNFKTIEAIDNEADELKLKLAELNNSTDYPNYVSTADYLDSLSQLKGNIQEYTLQNAALLGKNITDTVNTMAGKIKLSNLENQWPPLSERMDEFIRSILYSELVTQTSVGDRIKDFKNNADRAFREIKNLDINSNLQEAKSINQEISALYDEFLKDFIVTSKNALSRLSLEDSLILHLTEDNFYSPVTNEMYKIIIMDDSSAVKVESPVLLDEVKQTAVPIANRIEQMPFLPKFAAYFDTLAYIKDKAYQTRRAIRKNTDIFIKYKEVEELINQFATISVSLAYEQLNTFKNNAEPTESYSDLSLYIKDALNGVRIFSQAYSKNFFGNLDSLNNDLVVLLEQYNELLGKVRRLPRGVENFEQDIETLNALLNQIKEVRSDALLTNLNETEAELGDLLLFTEEGKKKTVYGIFKRRIKNFGYIYKDVKSWEEDQQ